MQEIAVAILVSASIAFVLYDALRPCLSKKPPHANPHCRGCRLMDACMKKRLPPR